MNAVITKWQFALQSIEKYNSVALLYVLKSKGSSPGRQGFCMFVNEEEKMVGSIGGGIMEHKFVEMVKDNFKNYKKENSFHCQIHDKSALQNQSGMICSGEQSIAVTFLSNKNVNSIQSIIQSLKENKKITIHLSSIDFFTSSDEMNFQYEFEKINENNWVYKESLGYSNHLTIIGGGHCALAFSKIMFDLNFYIRLYDDRESLNTMEQNVFVHEKIFLNNYSDLNNKVVNLPNHFIVLMTMGYRTDAIAIRALKDKHCKYLGILGSKNKTNQLLNELKNEGYGKQFIESISTPIGLQIKSETPEEIAISIAAEIIQYKNN